MPAMRSTRELSPHEWGLLILGLTVFLSLLVRLFAGLLVGFPINDGGMFYVMARDLRLNGFVLPAFTTYNNAGIPFAYPPLGFYVVAFLSAVGIPELSIVQWLPILVSSLSGIAFFLLARAVLQDEPRAAVAAMFSALIPGSYDMQIMGGGVTRTFGLLFFILSVYAVYKLFETSSWKHVILAAAFCSLAVLGHPEIILATATACALCWIFYGMTWKKTGLALLVAAGTVGLTAPWWGTVLALHGPAPFLSALNTGAYRGLPFAALYADFLAPLSLFSLFGLLRWAGIIWSLWKRRFFPVAWVFLPYFVEPRSAAAASALPSAMLMALAVTDVLPALAALIRREVPRATLKDVAQQGWVNAAVLILMFGFTVAGALHDFSLANTTLKPPDPQNTMEWVKQNTPEASQFLILTGHTGVATDPIQEWFPALTGRRSQTTSQGLEWTLGPAFFTRINQLIALQQCADAACVENWSAETGLSYTDILVERSALTSTLIDSLDQRQDYHMIFASAKYRLYESPR